MEEHGGDESPQLSGGDLGVDLGAEVGERMSGEELQRVAGAGCPEEGIRARAVWVAASEAAVVGAPRGRVRYAEEARARPETPATGAARDATSRRHRASAARSPRSSAPRALTRAPGARARALAHRIRHGIRTRRTHRIRLARLAAGAQPRRVPRVRRARHPRRHRGLGFSLSPRVPAAPIRQPRPRPQCSNPNSSRPKTSLATARAVRIAASRRAVPPRAPRVLRARRLHIGKMAGARRNATLVDNSSGEQFAAKKKRWGCRATTSRTAAG